MDNKAKNESNRASFDLGAGFNQAAVNGTPAGGANLSTPKATKTLSYTRTVPTTYKFYDKEGLPVIPKGPTAV
jgi:hypothetical protein